MKCYARPPEGCFIGHQHKVVDRSRCSRCFVDGINESRVLVPLRPQQQSHGDTRKLLRTSVQRQPRSRSLRTAHSCPHGLLHTVSCARVSPLGASRGRPPSASASRAHTATQAPTHLENTRESTSPPTTVTVALLSSFSAFALLASPSGTTRACACGGCVDPTLRCTKKIY